MKNKNIINCLGCTTKWHSKNSKYYTNEIYSCPNCAKNEEFAKKIRSDFGLRKVRNDKKTLLQHRKVVRERVARFRQKQLCNALNNKSILENLN